MSGIGSIMNYSLSGMQRASVRFTQSANRIVSAGTEISAVENVAPIENTDTQPVTPISSISRSDVDSTAYLASGDVYADEAVEMQLAKFSFKAGIAAYKVADEMSQELLSMVNKEA